MDMYGKCLIIILLFVIVIIVIIVIVLFLLLCPFHTHTHTHTVCVHAPSHTKLWLLDHIRMITGPTATYNKMFVFVICF